MNNNYTATNMVLITYIINTKKKCSKLCIAVHINRICSGDDFLS